jgi:hypothetical protein
MLYLPILLWPIRARNAQAQLNAMHGEEKVQIYGVIFLAIVSLQGWDRELELWTYVMSTRMVGGTFNFYHRGKVNR